MKRIILSLSIVLMLASSSFSQDVRPTGFWLDLFFPEVVEYMDEMGT